MNDGWSRTSLRLMGSRARFWSLRFFAVVHAPRLPLSQSHRGPDVSPLYQFAGSPCPPPSLTTSPTPLPAVHSNRPIAAVLPHPPRCGAKRGATIGSPIPPDTSWSCRESNAGPDDSLRLPLRAYPGLPSRADGEQPVDRLRPASPPPAPPSYRVAPRLTVPDLDSHGVERPWRSTQPAEASRAGKPCGTRAPWRWPWHLRMWALFGGTSPARSRGFLYPSTPFQPRGGPPALCAPVQTRDPGGLGTAWAAMLLKRFYLVLKPVEERDPVAEIHPREDDLWPRLKGRDRAGEDVFHVRD